MLDLTKPVQTRDGRPARIVATDLNLGSSNKRTLLVITEHSNGTNTFGSRYADGKIYTQQEDNLDIINVPVETVYYSRLYGDGSSLSAYRSTCHTKKVPGECESLWFEEKGIGWLKFTYIDDVLIDVEFIKKYK